MENQLQTLIQTDRNKTHFFDSKFLRNGKSDKDILTVTHCNVREFLGTFAGPPTHCPSLPQSHLTLYSSFFLFHFILKKSSSTLHASLIQKAPQFSNYFSSLSFPSLFLSVTFFFFSIFIVSAFLFSKP